MERKTRVLLIIATCVAVVVCFGIKIWHESRHRFDASCDQRLHPKTPQNECTDYYGDYGEVSCTPETFKYTPCPRAGALGGCRGKGSIAWYYRGKDGDEKWHCASWEKALPADWKEPEE